MQIVVSPAAKNVDLLGIKAYMRKMWDKKTGINVNMGYDVHFSH